MSTKAAKRFQQHITYYTGVFFSQCPVHEVERAVASCLQNGTGALQSAAFVRALFDPPDGLLAKAFRAVLSRMYSAVVPRELRGRADGYITFDDCLSEAYRTLYRHIVLRLDLRKSPGEIVAIILMWVYQELVRRVRQELGYLTRRVFPSEDVDEESHLDALDAGDSPDTAGLDTHGVDEDGVSCLKKTVRRGDDEDK